ncbi:hypothetical protein NC651_025604 [Populus alba x Populus x berolinensis]|nr:hypothetical protein NC651_025604 [Populus alba x Populus x berolinensis]
MESFQRESVRKYISGFNVHEEFGRAHYYSNHTSRKDMFTVRLKLAECPTSKTDNKTRESLS